MSELPETKYAFRDGTDRTVAPSETLKRVGAIKERVGITRVANVTFLDKVGIPTVAVCRPNSRSLSVAQGKGATLPAAQVSGMMEAIESFHAEHVEAPLLHGSFDEVQKRHRVVDVTGLPRLTSSSFQTHRPLLWAGGINLIGGEATLVPFELVHTDFRLPLPAGSGGFLMSSNGLASGNVQMEAVSHALCELVERDGNTLFGVCGNEEQRSRKVDLATIDDPTCRWMMDRFEQAGIALVVWDTTSDVGIPSFLCTVVERDEHLLRQMPPVSGSGCHPRRSIALSRAISEAAQGRLTLISGARDDFSKTFSTEFFDQGGPLIQEERRRLLREAVAPGARSFLAVKEVANDTVEDDLRCELQLLMAAGFRQVVVVDLSREEFGIPVVRAVVPGLEAMSEVPGYVLGLRARDMLRRAST